MAKFIVLDKMVGACSAILSDELMMVLAVLLIPPTFLPLYIPLSPFTIGLFRLLNDLIIGVFVAEYAAKLLVAESRMAHVRNPWHVLDLLIVLLAGVDLLGVPFAAGRASPLLRLFRLSRLIRFVAIAGRTVQRSKLLEPHPILPMPSSQPMILRVVAAGVELTSPIPADLLRHLQAAADTWIDLQHIVQGDVAFLSDALGVPQYALTRNVIQESFPRVDYYKTCTAIYLRDTRLRTLPEQGIEITTHGSIILCLPEHVLLTLCTGESEILDTLKTETAALSAEPFPVRMLYAILKRKVNDYEEIVRMFEQQTTLLEQDGGGRTARTFLKETFLLKRNIQHVLYHLWHFRQMVSKIRLEKITPLPLRDETPELLTLLRDEATYLYETLSNVKDSVISIIDLHLNAVSFEMNRVMKILAVLTCLSMIPATISGLLGQNLVDQPFSVTLPEITGLILALVVLAMYFFWRKGWLR